jgi:trehalose 6-phosphate phosphatase
MNSLRSMNSSEDDVFTSDHLPPWEARDLSSVALLLDIDGTILDVAPTPTSVVVPETLRASLAELQVRCGGALALVSGRLIETIDGLFSPLRLAAIGGHGAQMRMHADEPVRLRTGPTIGSALRKLISGISPDPRVVVEDKGSSLAVHYRLAPDLGPALELKVRSIVDAVTASSLEVMHGKLVIEIKSGKVNKGEAVRELMRNPPFAQRTPVFVGDDVTDESVFRILPGLGGVGYSVERFMTGVSGCFPTPGDVRAWLAHLGGQSAATGS